MKSVSSAIINTPYCQTQIVTFKEFVELIPKKEWYSYTDKVGYFRRKARDCFEPYETVTKYFTKASITVAELVEDLPILDRRKYDLMEMVYDIATESAVNMGYPTHMVRLGRRFWMAANPEDFMIFFNQNGSAVANMKPRNSVVWLVGRGKK